MNKYLNLKLFEKIGKNLLVSLLILFIFNLFFNLVMGQRGFFTFNFYWLFLALFLLIIPIFLMTKVSRYLIMKNKFLFLLALPANFIISVVPIILYMPFNKFDGEWELFLIMPVFFFNILANLVVVCCSYFRF